MGRLPMMIKASGRSALIVVTGLFVCFAGVSYTTAATEAATLKTETATATKSAKQGTRHWKWYAHRKDSRTALKSSSSTKAAENEVADASGDVPVTIPPLVANANALLADAPSDSAGAPDQLNDVDRTLQEAAPPSQTVAMAPNSAVQAVASAPASAGNDNSTWDQTSLIGKIFIAFGALLTVASAVRLFMA